jgi:hypothetical protein
LCFSHTPRFDRTDSPGAATIPQAQTTSSTQKKKQQQQQQHQQQQWLFFSHSTLSTFNAVAIAIAIAITITTITTTTTIINTIILVFTAIPCAAAEHLWKRMATSDSSVNCSGSAG